MARPKRNPLAPQSQGTVTQAELLELKFLRWQAQHADEFGLDSLRERNLCSLAESRIRQKLLEGCAVDPGELSALLRWGWREGKGRKWRHASLLVKNAPGKCRAKVEPAGDPLEAEPMIPDSERESPGWGLAFALCRVAAPFAEREQLERFAKHLGVSPQDLLDGGGAAGD